MHDWQLQPIIGLEIHVQLATRTKLFCGCPVEFAAEPNSRVCPVCLGLPGTLPVMNRQAFAFAVRAAIALNCAIAKFTKWDRKSYYYPDMPKNYQISQYDLPLSHDGRFDVPLPDGSLKPIGIIRAHLEEDAGKNLHEGLDHTRVDLNRAGTPLLEIVTRPDLSDADEAYTFCVELQRLVQYLGISEASMQKGQMRFEPNVNVAITGDGREYRTPISEIKNLNSFRAVRDAIRYEIDRQVKAWEADHEYTLEKVGKLNFGWDDARGVTEFQRGKEESHDYRYFPDPDLVPVVVEEAWIDELRRDIGELPQAKGRRFVSQYGMSAQDCEIILADQDTGVLYEAVVQASRLCLHRRDGGATAQTLTRQFVGIWHQLASAAETTVGGLGVPAGSMAELAKLAAAGTISATAAAQIAQEMYVAVKTAARESRVERWHGRGLVAADPRVGRRMGKHGRPRPRPCHPPPPCPAPLEIAQRLGLIQERDESALQAWVDEVFAANPQAVKDALHPDPKKTKGPLGFLRGQVMKVSQGKADPRLTGELVERKLNELRQPR